jgi:hypothetical protein
VDLAINRLLANDLSVGPVPWQFLTFPEQLLVAHLYPRIYVFKLYTKSGSSDPSKLQLAMHGSVGTYDLDMHGISSMIDGNLMPRRPSVLASVISVAFIGL